jgi:methylmalonyl-CoA carboxyltransferase 12S subunit
MAFGLILVPLAVVGGWAAGALTARYLVRQEIGKLRELLEGRGRADAPAAAAAPPAEAPRPAPEPQPREAGEEEVGAETLSILAAVVAAYLGKRARVRGARLVRTGAQSSPWAQQGRVYIQASHVLPRQ